MNASKHWRNYLRGWKVAGLATDPELGAFVARHLFKLLARGRALGGEPSAIPSSLLGPNLSQHVQEINNLMRTDGADIARALAAEGLFSTEARQSEWIKLCALPPERAIDWTRDSLPELSPWFESRFFGAHRCNFPLEAGFSVFGKHVESEQGADLKEAIVLSSQRQQRERQFRRTAAFRAPKKVKKRRHASLYSRPRGG